MPRGASKSAEEKAVKNKVNARKGKEGALGQTPRKRTASKKTATDTKPARKTTPRKAPAKKPATPRKSPARKPTTKKPAKASMIEEAVAVEQEVTIKQRKAPTRFAAASDTKRKQRNQLIIVAAVLAVGISASAVLGFTDTTAGQIDVAQTIKDRNERMANMVDVDGPVVTAPTPSALPDGGLIGVQPTEPRPTPPPVPLATTTASSSLGIGGTASSSATSSDAVNQTGDTPVAADREQFVTDTATTTVEANDPTLTTLAGQ